MTDLETAAGSRVWCIVVAGGSGRRFGAAKQFLELDGTQLLRRCVDTAATVADGVVVVLPDDPSAFGQADLPSGVVTVPGGSTRSASVRAGLAAVPDDADVVLVHDAARPLASPALFRRVIEALSDADAVVPAVAVTDTIRTVDGETVDRDRLRAVQTPQGFRTSVLRDAHAEEPDATDDAGLVDAAGGSVVMVEGETTNLKVTTRGDLIVAGALLDVAHEAPEPPDSEM